MPPPNNRLALPARNAMLDPNALGQTVPAPYIPGATPTPASRFVPGRELENLSIGIGRGITGQLEGAKQMLTNPVGTVRSILEAARQIGADPMTVLRMLQSARQQAMSGGLGAGEMIGGMLPMPKLGNPMRELDVYHGTPHRFPPTPNNPLGEFDASKIGTGEGAQAYGHGVYLAESPKVAGGYAEKLAYTSKIPMSGYDVASRSNPELVQKLKAVFGDDEIRINRAIVKPTEFRNLSPELKAEINAFKRQSKGTLYKADLPDEMIGRMLDWDKPLKEQPANVQKFFSPIYKPDDYLVDWLKQGDANHIAEILREAGIPGIKYLDAGSRGQGGTGTRNFVVFPGEEKKVRILERK